MFRRTAKGKAATPSWADAPLHPEMATTAFPVCASVI
jgi:hypothetical protein